MQPFTDFHAFNRSFQWFGTPKFWCYKSWEIRAIRRAQRKKERFIGKKLILQILKENDGNGS